MTTDMTKGKPLGSILRFMLPMLAGALIQQLYGILDMLVIGNFVGSRAMAAIGAADAPAFFARAIVIGLTTGITSVAARHFGAKDSPMLRKTLAMTLYISLACAALLALAGIFGAEPVMRLLQTPEDIIADAVLYLRITLGGGAAMVLSFTLSAILRAVGDSKTPTVFIAVAFALNIPLTLLFVAVFGWGAAGAAFATITAQTLSAMACLVYMFRKFEIFRLAFSDFKPHLRTIGAILRIGLPVGTQTLLLAGGDMTIMGVVNTFGADIVAAYTVGLRVMLMAMVLSMNLAMAHSVFAAQNLGANELERIRRGFRNTAFVMLGLSLATAAAVFAFGDSFVRFFIADTDAYIEIIVPIARNYLRIGTAFYIFLGMIWLYNYTLSGMGDVVMPFVSSLFELASKVGLTIYLSGVFGYAGIWFAMPIGWVLGVVPSAVRFHTGGWKRYARRQRLEGRS